MQSAQSWSIDRWPLAVDRRVLTPSGFGGRQGCGIAGGGVRQWEWGPVRHWLHWGSEKPRPSTRALPAAAADRSHPW
jgi:hypothetical protein